MGEDTEKVIERHWEKVKSVYRLKNYYKIDANYLHRQVKVIHFILTGAPWEDDTQGAVSIRKTVLPGMAIPMLKIRRPNGRLIFNMEIAIRR